MPWPMIDWKTGCKQNNSHQPEVQLPKVGVPILDLNARPTSGGLVGRISARFIDGPPKTCEVSLSTNDLSKGCPGLNSPAMAPIFYTIAMIFDSSENIWRGRANHWMKLQDPSALKQTLVSHRLCGCPQLFPHEIMPWLVTHQKSNAGWLVVLE